MKTIDCHTTKGVSEVEVFVELTSDGSKKREQEAAELFGKLGVRFPMGLTERDLADLIAFAAVKSAKTQDELGKFLSGVRFELDALDEAAWKLKA